VSSPAGINTQKQINHATPPLREALLLVFSTLLVLLIYSNSLHAPFILDDRTNIEDNSHIRLTSLSLEGLNRAGFESLLPRRPVANISFALNYYVHQYSVHGYHWVNLIIHVMTGLFLYLFIKTTLNLPSQRSRYTFVGWIPLVTVLLWLVHPLQTQSVTYIVQRMNSMAALFYVLSMLLYVRARLAGGKKMKVILFGGCVLAGALSLGSKEIAATLPLFILLYEWYFIQDLDGHWVRRNAVVFVAILGLIAVVAWLYLGGQPLAFILNGYAIRDFTLTERVLTEFRVVFFYLSLFFFPHPARLNLDHDFPLSHSLLDPFTTVLAIGAVIGLVGLAIWLARRERLLSFCILWFLGNLVIESSVIGLEIVFEHRMYLPSMMLVLMLAVLACRYVRSRGLGVVILCGMVLVLSMWTYERNGVWRDKVTLWQDCVAKSPNKARPHYNLGVSFSKKGNMDKAIDYYQKTLRIDPQHVGASNNLGNQMLAEGKLGEAFTHFSNALQEDPYNVEVNYNLGNLYKAEGKFDDAADAYQKALHIQPGHTDAINNLATVYLMKGNHDKALPLYMKMIDLEPDNFVAYYNLACMYAIQNKVDESINWLKQSVKNGFSDWDVLKNDKDLDNIKDTSYFKSLLARSMGL
jgi:tetratricopeptide (TPR) repeat protein